MALHWKCGCGEFNTKQRKQCGGCGEPRAARQPRRVGGPKGADSWAKEPWQRSWKNWPKPRGGQPQQQGSAG
eukprot:8446648-Pyramimonas_sp.AAC.1